MRTSDHAGSRRRLLLAVLGLGVAAAGVAAAVGWARVQRLAREKESLEASAEAASRLVEENRSLETQRAALNEELERLRRQTQEIHKLRAQYPELQRLREDHAQLEQENAQLKAQVQSLGAQLQAASARGPTVAPQTRLPAVGTAWLGIALTPLGPANRPEDLPPTVAMGLFIQSLIPGGPALNSGLEVGDVIVSVEGQPVATVQELQDRIRNKRPGQSALLELYRGAQLLRIQAATSAVPPFQ